MRCVMTDHVAMLSEQVLRQEMNTAWAGHPVIFFEEVDSTNRLLMQMAAQGASHGTLAVAELQTAGRGRRGRSWYSPKGSGIWMSLLLRPEIAAEKTPMLTLCAALAAYDALTPLAQGCRIKWPNDIVLNGKKVCGILTELGFDPDGSCFVVIGIGINVNTPAFAEELADVAASFYTETGRTFDRAPLIGRLWQAFEKYYEMFLAAGNLAPLKEIYNSRLVNIGKTVRIEGVKIRETGTSLGIDDEGALGVMLENGVTRYVTSGEVSVRGVLGYI